MWRRWRLDKFCASLLGVHAQAGSTRPRCAHQVLRRSHSALPQRAPAFHGRLLSQVRSGADRSMHHRSAASTQRMACAVVSSGSTRWPSHCRFAVIGLAEKGTRMVGGQPDNLSSVRRFLFMASTMPIFSCAVAGWLAVETGDPIIPAAIVGWFVGMVAGILCGAALRRHSWLQIGLGVLAPPAAVVTTFLFTGNGRIAVAAGFLVYTAAILGVRRTPQTLPRYAASGVCHWCGYDLRGLRCSRCPECGRSCVSHPPTGDNSA